MFGAHPAGREDLRGGEEEEERAEGEEGEEALDGGNERNPSVLISVKL